MDAQVIEAFNTPYALKRLPIPKVASEHEILIRVDAAGYCHTDAVLAAGNRKGDPSGFPHIGGHEFAGGSNGLSKDGGFAQYALVDARQCVILPDDLPAVDAAPLMRAGVTIYNAIKRCELKLGQRIGIVGCGGDLGHLGLQFADAMGLRVTGVDAADGPLQLARSLGTRADIVDARATPVEEVVLKIGAEDGKTDRADMGLDAVIILPESQISFEYGTKLLRNHSLCLVVSIPVNGFRVSAWDLVFRDITVRGTILGTNEILRETVEFAAKHGVRPIKKTYALADLNGLVDEYKKGWGGKFVLDVSK